MSAVLKVTYDQDSKEFPVSDHFTHEGIHYIPVFLRDVKAEEAHNWIVQTINQHIYEIESLKRLEHLVFLFFTCGEDGNPLERYYYSPYTDKLDGQALHLEIDKPLVLSGAGGSEVIVMRDNTLVVTADGTTNNSRVLTVVEGSVTQQ